MEKYQYLLPLVWPVVTGVVNLGIAAFHLENSAFGQFWRKWGTVLIERAAKPTPPEDRDTTP